MGRDDAFRIALLDETAHPHAGQAAAPRFGVLPKPCQDDFFLTAEKALQPLVGLGRLKQAHISIGRQAGVPIAQVIAVIGTGHTAPGRGGNIHRAGQNRGRRIANFAQGAIRVFNIRQGCRCTGPQ